MNFDKLIAAAFFTVFVFVAAVSAEDAKTLPPASAKANVTYATDIKPIFDQSCVKCHSGEKPRGRFKLDTLENALKGGKEGNAIIPGKSADSMLVHMVARISEDSMEWMPPVKSKDKFPPLTAEQVGLIRAWIDQGAK